jgi:hypothetical protein
MFKAGILYSRSEVAILLSLQGAFAVLCRPSSDREIIIDTKLYKQFICCELYKFSIEDKLVDLRWPKDN